MKAYALIYRQRINNQQLKYCGLLDIFKTQKSAHAAANDGVERVLATYPDIEIKEKFEYDDGSILLITSRDHEPDEFHAFDVVETEVRS